MAARKQHSLTSAKAWSRYMPGGAGRRPYKESQHPRLPKGVPGGGRFMRVLNGGLQRPRYRPEDNRSPRRFNHPNGPWSKHQHTSGPGIWRVNEPLLPVSRVLRSGFHIDQQYRYPDYRKKAK